MKKKPQSRKKGLNRSYPKAWTEPLNTWLETLKVVKKSEGTIRKREVCIKVFLDHMKANKIKSFKDVTEEHAKEFAGYLRKREYSPEYIEATMRSAKYFLDHLEDEFLIFSNPFDKVTIPVAKGKRQLVLNQEQMRLLLEAPDTSTPLGIRDKALLEVMYSTGCRVLSMLSMRWSWVDFKNGVATVIIKNDRQQVVPLGKHATHYLEKYLEEGYRLMLDDDNEDPDKVWLNSRGKPIISNFSHIVKRHAVSVDVPKEVNCHCIRRSCATHFLQGGASPMMVAELLGQNDMSSLSSYLQVPLKDIAEMHNNSKLGE